MKTGPILILMLLTACVMPAAALLVYECDDPDEADLLVYERDYSMNCDLWVDVKASASWAEEEAEWYFTDEPDEAELVIYFTTDKNKADLLIWYVVSSHQAGWRGYHPYKDHLADIAALRETHENY